MKNEISIICSNYNSGRWIDEYLEYVNSQELENFDIVFIDVNSSDDSLDKIKKYNFRKGIRKVIIQYPERIGFYRAWNIAIKAAETKYIIYYNTDDMLFSNALSVYNLYSFNNPDIDVFYSPCGFVDTRDPKAFIGFGEWQEYSHEALLKNCLCGPFPMVKKLTIERIGFFNEDFISSGDYELWLRMSKAGYKFKKIPNILGSFYFRPDSIHSANSEIAEQEDSLIKEKYK